MNIWANSQATPSRLNAPFHDPGIIIGSQATTRLNEGKNLNFFDLFMPNPFKFWLHPVPFNLRRF